MPPRMPPRIAIPMPHSTDREYGERAIPQYERAVQLAGGEPVRIPLDQSAAEVMKMIDRCDGVLLPGSNADVDPARFRAPRSLRTAAADPRREAVDDLLLDDAYKFRKPVLGICYGLQSLNVHLRGSLIQHIPDSLPEETRAKINHEAGKKIAVAHSVEITADSKLAEILCGDSRPRQSGQAQFGTVLDSDENRNGRENQEEHENREEHDDREGHQNREGHGLSRANQDLQKNRALAPEGKLILPVNSSHHQSADAIGTGLRIVARCPDDGIIEAVEGTAPDHFVIAVQWHPERSVDDDPASRAIFHALIEAAKQNGR
jgi:putative glutamine amidotransferase